MARILDLPAELQLMVFEHLDDSQDRFNVVSVSRVLYGAAMEALYGRVVLDGRRSMIQYLRTVCARPRLAMFCKVLVLCGDHYYYRPDGVMTFRDSSDKQLDAVDVQWPRLPQTEQWLLIEAMVVHAHNSASAMGPRVAAWWQALLSPECNDVHAALVLSMVPNVEVLELYDFQSPVCLNSVAAYALCHPAFKARQQFNKLHSLILDKTMLDATTHSPWYQLQGIKRLECRRLVERIEDAEAYDKLAIILGHRFAYPHVTDLVLHLPSFVPKNDKGAYYYPRSSNGNRLYFPNVSIRSRLMKLEVVYQQRFWLRQESFATFIGRLLFLNRNTLVNLRLVYQPDDDYKEARRAGRLQHLLNAIQSCGALKQLEINIIDVLGYSVNIRPALSAYLPQSLEELTLIFSDHHPDQDKLTRGSIGARLDHLYSQLKRIAQACEEGTAPPLKTVCIRGYTGLLPMTLLESQYVEWARDTDSRFEAICKQNNDLAKQFERYGVTFKTDGVWYWKELLKRDRQRLAAQPATDSIDT